MKTIVVFVTTLDGKVTKWGDPHVMRWSSKEDQTYFKKIWRESPLIIMGSGTFDFDPIQPPPNSLLIVMTHEPEEYSHLVIPGKLEFSLETPSEIVERFKGMGYEQMLVVGGAHVATSFFKGGLVDEMWLTLEPKIFGEGGNFAIGAELDVELALMSMEKVNERGTLILKYRVLNNS